jgi:hypothetical protein
MLLSVNGKIKNWRFFSQTINNSNIPHTGDYLRIICALINAYHRTRVADTSAHEDWAIQMRNLVDKENRLKRRLELLASGTQKPRWRKYDSRMLLFPVLSEDDVRNLCYGN